MRTFSCQQRAAAERYNDDPTQSQALNLEYYSQTEFQMTTGPRINCKTTEATLTFPRVINDFPSQ